MTATLSEPEIRIFGCLLEKKMATPEYYPLSLNALVNACNQKTNRHPVVSYDEKNVTDALESLKAKNIVFQSNVGRVSKYEEIFTRERKMINQEEAVLCILMLRGPQTVGEIKSRTERLFRFENLAEVLSTLSTLEEHGYAQKLPRLPGTKESRYMHMFLELQTYDVSNTSNFSEGKESNRLNTRVSGIEEELRVLRDEVAELKQTFLSFKKQFE